MIEVVVGGLITILAGVLAVLIPPAIKGRRNARARDQLIEDLVLGDPDRGMRSMRELIEDRTIEIQPQTNGGTSLSDLHAKVDQVDAKVEQNAATLSRHIADAHTLGAEITTRLSDVEKAKVEAHKEGEAMWKAIDSLAKGS